MKKNEEIDTENSTAGARTGHLPQSFSNHATLVAGVMVAERNGEGAVGVYNARTATNAGGDKVISYEVVANDCERRLAA